MSTIDIIQVPEALLKSKELLPSAKLVWVALTLESITRLPQHRTSITGLANMIGLSRPTVYKALTALKSSGWHPDNERYVKQIREPYILIYTDLLLNTALSLRARLFHGLLQLTSSYKNLARDIKYSSLSTELEIGEKTVRNTIKQLVRNGWLVMKQTHRLATITLSICHPVKEQFRVMMARAENNILNAKYKGEALMKEFLSLIVSSDNYIDNAKPGFLRNCTTDSLMELDRYYPDVVAFEYNGPQHYRPTDLFDAQTVEKQRARDILKRQLCSDRNIKIITIHPEDLTINSLVKKIGFLLPLRDIRGAERLINYLEKLSAKYRRKVPGLQQQ